MTAEWNRRAILDLINEYKNQINLYDIKHMLVSALKDIFIKDPVIN